MQMSRFQAAIKKALYKLQPENAAVAKNCRRAYVDQCSATSAGRSVVSRLCLPATAIPIMPQSILIWLSPLRRPKGASIWLTTKVQHLPVEAWSLSGLRQYYRLCIDTSFGKQAVDVTTAVTTRTKTTDTGICTTLIRKVFNFYYTAKDLVPYEGSVATHGKFFPRDAKGVRAVIVFIVDEDNDEAMEVRAERVSEDGQVLEAVRHFWSPDVDWQTLCVWQEHHDRAEAMIDDSIKRGEILLC
ncbi:hypothetical protein SELMODRAFT_404516 [Selaginella moellendorffii]|uniref:Uncharacterized protein n=1 Tax=Selaginella moellendorffii TaxID=88036 RepID=D8QVK8_SELML|nr:hypothetical protein SELMODRAFT_404516 [Selaginella moellendorffii]